MQIKRFKSLRSFSEHSWKRPGIKGMHIWKATKYLEHVTLQKRCVPFHRDKGGVGGCAQAKQWGWTQGWWLSHLWPVPWPVWLSGLEHCLVTEMSGAWYPPSWGTYLGCRFVPWSRLIPSPVQACAGSNQLMFFTSMFLSFPLSLLKAMKKMSLGEDFKKVPTVMPNWRV